MTIKVTGINRAKGLLRLLQKESPKKLERGLLKAGKFLLKESKKVTPLDTGFLRASGKVVVNTSDKFRPELTVEYTAPYAVYVHENPDAFHPVGDYKYLERPAREYRLHMIWLVEREFK